MTTTLAYPSPANGARLFALGAALLASLMLTLPAAAQRPRGGGAPPDSAARAGGPPPDGRGGRGGFGRGGPGGPQAVDGRLAMLTQQLSLSDAQASQVHDILLAEQQQLEALRPATPPTTAPDSATRAQMMEQMRAIRDDTNTRIRAVLSADQQAKFDAAPRGPDGGGPGGGRGGRGGRGGPPPDGAAPPDGAPRGGARRRGPGGSPPTL